MSYTKLSTQDFSIDLEAQPVSSLSPPPYTNSSPLLPSNPTTSPFLNHSEDSLLALAQIHFLTATDIQFLASRPEFTTFTPEESARDQRQKTVAGYFSCGFIVFWVACVVFIVVMGIKTTF
jgi:hypothetical protein